MLGPTRTAVYTNLQPLIALLIAGRHRRDAYDLSGGWRRDHHRRRFSDQSMRLVLFDIDGTLLNSGGMGRALMQRALAEVFGSPGNPKYRYDGKTDKQIVRDTMRLEGHTDEHIDSQMETLIDLYLAGLQTRCRAETQRSPARTEWWHSSTRSRLEPT